GPGADAAVQEGIAKLSLAGSRIGEVAERAVERLETIAHARIDHARQRVVPQVLLKESACASLRSWIGKYAVGGVSAAHAGGFHAARGRKVGGPQTHAVHARTGGSDRL